MTHIETRWLSLHSAIEKLIRLFVPLSEYFGNINEKEMYPVLVSVLKEGSSDIFLTFFIFLENILFICNTCTKQLESSDILIVETYELIKIVKKRKR